MQVFGCSRHPEPPACSNRNTSKTLCRSSMGLRTVILNSSSSSTKESLAQCNVRSVDDSTRDRHPFSEPEHVSALVAKALRGRLQEPAASGLLPQLVCTTSLESRSNTGNDDGWSCAWQHLGGQKMRLVVSNEADGESSDSTDYMST